MHVRKIPIGIFVTFGKNHCKKSLLGRNLEKTGSERQQFQVEDHSENDPRLFPGSLQLNSRKSRERVRSDPGDVASKETHLA